MLLSIFSKRPLDEKRLNRNTNIQNSNSSSNMAATIVESPPPQLITTIEWSMMDKAKFFPLSMLSSFSGNIILLLLIFQNKHL